jgi:hypothetical protein
MKRVMAAALGASFVLFGSPWALAQDQFRPFTPAESRAFEVCIYAAWVEDYCESMYWGFAPASARIRACVRANSGGRFPVEPHHLYANNEEYCRIVVQRPYR